MNHELWKIRRVNVGSSTIKGTALVGVLLLEEPAHVREEGRGVISVLSPQLCYEAKTALRKINRIKNKNQTQSSGESGHT